MAKAKEAVKAPALELNVNFGNLNVGVDTCRIGVSVDRKQITPAKADSQLCGKRLIGSIVTNAGNANAEQPAMFEAGETVAAAFDVKSFNTKRKSISFGLTFALGSVDINKATHFASRSGKLIVNEMTEIPEEEKGKDEHEDEEDE